MFEEMENMLKQKFKQDKAMTRILKQQSESEIEEKEESEEVCKNGRNHANVFK